MIISAKTKISKLIDENKDTIEVISSINKHFKKLKNPLLRKALAPRVNITDAARIGGVPVCVMIDKLKEIGFTTDDECGCETASPQDKYRLNEKKIEMRKENIVELDVRPILAGGVDPFEAIMAELKKMDDSQTLLIINTFEPIPLLNILKKKGYDYQTERPENGLVHTYLEKFDGEAKHESAEKEQIGKQGGAALRHLDQNPESLMSAEGLEFSLTRIGDSVKVLRRFFRANVFSSSL